MMDSSVIDLAILADVIGDHPDKLYKFAHKFVDSTGLGIAELHECLARGDIGRMRELGHRIKSSARIVGALGMGDLCERLEKLAPQEPQAELAQARELIAQMGPLLQQISSVIASPPSSTT